MNGGLRCANPPYGLTGGLMTYPAVFKFTLVSLIALALPAAAQTRQDIPKIGDPPEALNMRLVGYNDLQGRSAYQPTIVHQGSRYITYVGHHGGSKETPEPLNVLTGKHELNGTSVLDVGDPKNPKYIAH